MRFQPTLISLLVLSGFFLLSAQTVTKGDPQSKQIREVGQQLKCQCESHCSYTVAGCNMIGCSFRTAVTSEIRTDIDRGLSTSEIVDGLIAKYGLDYEIRHPQKASDYLGGLCRSPF